MKTLFFKTATLLAIVFLSAVTSTIANFIISCMYAVITQTDVNRIMESVFMLCITTILFSVYTMLLINSTITKRK
jgi:FtsH-binding integral membrane protein